MFKFSIILALVFYVTAEEYKINQNEHGQPCMDSANIAIKKAEAHKFFEEAQRLADEYNTVEGTEDSKFELFKPKCQEIEAKVLSALELPDLPLCRKTKKPYSERSNDKAIFAKHFYGLVCNLQKQEYRGLSDVIFTKAAEAAQFCFQAVERTSASHKEFLDFCNGDVSGMFDCFKRMLTGEDDLLAFHKALFTNWKGILCVGEFNENQYLWNLDQLATYFEKGSLIITSMMKPKHIKT